MILLIQGCKAASWLLILIGLPANRHGSSDLDGVLSDSKAPHHETKSHVEDNPARRQFLVDRL